MFEKAVDTNMLTLKFISDRFVASKMLKNLGYH